MLALTILALLGSGVVGLAPAPGAPRLALDRRSFSGAFAGTAAALLAPNRAAAAPAASWTLAGGVEMPTLALNTAGLSAQSAAEAVKLALAAGISHVDFHPGAERDGVAKALKNVDRSALFLTTKLVPVAPGTPPAFAAGLVRAQVSADLVALGVDRVDMLMMRDHPDCLVMAAQWAVCEDLLRQGKVRSLGTVNFCERQLECLLTTAVVQPSLNYFMLHPGMGSDAGGLRTFGEARGIRTFAYGVLGEPGPSPALLGEGGPLADAALAHGKPVEAVSIRWALQSGAAVSVRPTADYGLGFSACRLNNDVCAEGLAARAGATTFELTAGEMAALDDLRSPGGNPCLFSRACNPSREGLP